MSNGYGPDEFSSAWQDADSQGGTGTQDFRADAYEQLKLTEERRELENARREKHEAMKPCLEAKIKLADIARQTAVESRAAAEAERDRAKTRLLTEKARRRRGRDRRKLRLLEKELAAERN